MPNRLADQVSPYLLQHRDNPVDWWPWGPEALAAARAEGKPIFLSIGYAACHWCHVMAHESFENPEIAAVMNDLFVNIKVDREERPDIDQIYMSAIHAFGEQGGWPLSVFLTPDGVPVWGGTYFPPESRYGRPGFPDVLRRIAEIFRTDGEKIAQTSASVAKHLNRPPASAGGTTVDRALLDKAAETLHGIMDRRLGGPAGAPKFPQSALLETLWRAGTRLDDDAFTQTVITTLTGMSLGGIYDHVGGGYARYSVDAQWLVPHFEKMLYDNAQIVAMLTTAWAATGNPLFAERVGETIAWLEREMRTPEGAFAASLDADTEGEEGLTYVWTPDEVAAVLGPADAELFCNAYDITPGGNFEGRSIPNRLNTPPPLSDLEETRLADMRARLLEARSARPQPGLDDKVLADWNGLMIAALAQAAFVFVRPDWLNLAVTAFRVVEDTMGREDRLAHAWRDGRSVWPGLATDTAFMAHAALALAGVTGDTAYVDRAKGWITATERHHAAGDGYHLSADDADALIARPRADIDDAIPAATSLMAANHVRLWHLTGDDAHRARADAIIRGAGTRIATNTFASASLLNTLDLRLRAKTAVVVIPADADPTPALAPLRAGWSPNLIIQIVNADAPLPDSHPAAGKTAIDGRPTVYICREGACSLPATDSEAISAMLAGA